MSMVVFIGSFSTSLVSCPIFCLGSCVFLAKNVDPVSPQGDFLMYKEVLMLVKMSGETAEGLWEDNVNSFSHIKQSTQRAYDLGKDCQELKEAIALSGQNSLPEGALEELLEPLKSVKVYFPLLEKSFLRITADSLLAMMRLIRNFVSSEKSKDIEVAEKAYEKAIKLIDVNDCPDNVSISFDAFNISNLEAFELRGARMIDFSNRGSTNSRNGDTIDVHELIRKKHDEAEKRLNLWNLLADSDGNPRPEALDTTWTLAAKYYGMYKVCNLIRNRPSDRAEKLFDDIMSAFVDIIVSCIRDSPTILAKNMRKWTEDFREDKISAAIQLAGFARGVMDNVAGYPLHS
ncbi:hypothetical protein SUGI_0372330 [Cryptomeria japonica]|nr:hypothetical protein SUGI_0372330 [Cryptomeria japonica]